MRLVVVHGTDPSDGNTWSGTPKHIIEALREAGHVVKTVGPLPPVETYWRRAKSWSYRRFLGKEYHAIRDPAALCHRAAIINGLIGEHLPADAVIALHAADAAIVKISAPLIFIHDATWHELLDFYPRYERPRLAPETIAGGYELDRLALRNCDRAIYSSHWAADSVRSNYRIDADKLSVHPFGPNLTSIPRGEDLRRAIARRGSDPCRLLFVGVDWERKDGDTAIAVARQLHERAQPVELQIAGCEPPAGAPDYVRRFGFLSRKDAVQAAQLAQLFLQADFLLLPTRADCSPIVLNEAAANALPPVTSRIGAIPEIVGDGSWGVAFASGTAASDYADWIQAVHSNRSCYERMAWRARREFEERLNWGAFGCKLIAVIAEAQAARLGSARQAAATT